MTNLITTNPDEGLPAIPDGTNPYMPEAPGETLTPPVFKLVQGMSQAHTDGGIKEGVFFSVETGEIRETLQAVILRIQLTRTFWEAGQMEAPVCYSNDRLIAGPGVEWEGRACVECPKRDDTPWLKRETDMCTPGYLLMCLDPETQEPFVLRAGGTSANDIRTLRTLIKMKYHKMPFSVAVEFAAKKEKNLRGTFYVLRHKIIKVFSAEEISSYRAVADELSPIELIQEVPVETGDNLDSPF